MIIYDNALICEFAHSFLPNSSPHSLIPPHPPQEENFFTHVNFRPPAREKFVFMQTSEENYFASIINLNNFSLQSK